LVNRLETGGLVRRHRGTADRREVLLELTARGEKLLRDLSLDHCAELLNQGPQLLFMLQRLLNGIKPMPKRRK
jgi:DNA-binding MarR family transcriptional regulator